ncbi:MAG: FHA domain-containing protein, partial [Tannerella sp.]|nr:FHA domain-containing protein [Tannerella sp.]
FRGILSQFPEITLKKIVCPSCRTVLFVDPLKTGPLVCPHCRQERDASAYPEAQQPDSMSTVMPGQPVGNTLVRPGILTWMKGDSQVYTSVIILKKGINTIGRGQQCSIRINSGDEYISRMHTRIELAVKPDGTFEHLLADAGSVNGTYHNGERIGKNEVIVLRPSDLIRIGHTTYKFTEG